MRNQFHDTQAAGELITEAAHLLVEARAPGHIVDLLLDALRELSDLGMLREEPRKKGSWGG
jgi:hypothetical protein